MEQPGLVCPKCGGLIVKGPEPGAIYLCYRCGEWRAGPRDKKAEKAAQQENGRFDRLNVERDGPLPVSVLNRVKLLVRQECAGYEANDNGLKNSCVPAGKTCVFLADGEDHRCRWFEEAVLTLDDALKAAYCRIYSTDRKHGDAKGSSAKAEQQAKKTMAIVKEGIKKQCATPGCPNSFIPKGRSSRYCPECREKVKLASRQAYRNRKNRKVHEGSRESF